MATSALIALVFAVTVIIVIGIFLSRSTSEVKAEGFSQWYGKFPEETSPVLGGGSPGSPGTPAIPAAATTFVNAIKQAEAATDKEICRVEFDEYPASGNLNVRLVKDGNNMKIMVQINHGVPFMLEEIDNHAPCVADGNNFRTLLMGGTPSGLTYLDVLSVDIVEDDKMTIETTGGTGDSDLFKDNPLIYKAGTGHICLIPTFNDWWVGTEGCSEGEGTEIHYVDNDCLRKDKPVYANLENNIPIC